LGGRFKAILLLALGWFATRAEAVFVTNLPSADTTLIEIAPTNNNGGQAWVLAGKIQNDFYRMRALFKFDFTSLPTNALILSVAFNIDVTRVPDEPPVNSTFGLRRMLRPWGEGDKAATGLNPPGQGRPASAGDATWLCAYFPTNEWFAPGGAEGQDYSSTESSFEFIGGIGSYRFPSTPELVSDVQDWVNAPDSNHGWMLLSMDEITILTARRFASREDPDAHPALEVEFFAPPQIESVGRTGDQFALRFTAWSGQSYAVEFSDSVASGEWQTLTNLGLATATTQHLVTDPVTQPKRYYRVTAY